MRSDCPAPSLGTIPRPTLYATKLVEEVVSLQRLLSSLFLLGILLFQLFLFNLGVVATRHSAVNFASFDYHLALVLHI